MRTTPWAVRVDASYPPRFKFTFGKQDPGRANPLKMCYDLLP